MAKIFYFSGTGNSFHVAKKIGLGIYHCELINISYQTNIEISGENIIGIVFPVYYFGLPKVVEDFLNNIDFKRHIYLFVIATRGIPFAGGVRKQLVNILGNKMSYFQYITMGDNFNIDFWNSSSNKIKELRNSHCNTQIQKIVESINSRSNIRKYSLFDFMWLITKNFPRYGYESYLKKVYNSDNCFNVNNNICTGCIKCIKSCPVDNIRYDNEVQWKHKNCQLCLACYHCCPVNAVQYKNDYLTTKGKKQYWNY